MDACSRLPGRINEEFIFREAESESLSPRLRTFPAFRTLPLHHAGTWPQDSPGVCCSEHTAPTTTAESWLIQDLHQACVGPSQHICRSDAGSRALDCRFLIHLLCRGGLLPTGSLLSRQNSGSCQLAASFHFYLNVFISPTPAFIFHLFVSFSNTRLVKWGC